MYIGYNTYNEESSFPTMIFVFVLSIDMYSSFLLFKWVICLILKSASSQPEIYTYAAPLAGMPVTCIYSLKGWDSFFSRIKI